MLQVKWVSSKLPWIHPLPENSVNVVQLQYVDTNSSSKSVMVAEGIATSMPSEKKDLNQLNDQEKIKENNEKEKSAEIKLRLVSPSSETEQNEGGEKGPLHSLSSSTSEPLAMDSKEVHLKASINASDLNVTVASEKQTVKAPSKMSNISIKDQDAKQSKIPQVDNDIKTVPNKSEGENSTENKVLLSKEKPLCPPVPPQLGKSACSFFYFILISTLFYSIICSF